MVMSAIGTLRGPRICNDALRGVVRPCRASSFRRTDAANELAFAKTTFLSDLRADLALCKVPTLVLQRAQDVPAPVIVGAYVHTQTLVS